MSSLVMPLEFFADAADARIIRDRLNADDEIAFLRCDTIGRSRPHWRAARGVDQLEAGGHRLWHHPAGSFPHFDGRTGRQSLVANPWAGWTEPVLRSDGLPDSGLYHPALITMQLNSRHASFSVQEHDVDPPPVSTPDHDVLPISGFGWQGNYSWHYPADVSTTRWWKRMKAFLDREATRLDLPRGWPRVWVFPSALAKLAGGMEYSARGWDLRRAISAASR